VTDADVIRRALSDLCDGASAHAIDQGLAMAPVNAAYSDGLSALDRLEEWRSKTAPIIAALVIYGDRAILSSLAEKARALNEAKP
jgi:hypothetical protein